MPSTFELKIITPQGPAYSAAVSHTRVPTDIGTVGVLANHAPFITLSLGGVLEVREESGDEKKFRVGPGFFEVSRNRASFLTQSFDDIKKSGA